MQQPHRHSRRDFLKTSATVTVGAPIGLATTRAAADESVPEEPAELASLRRQAQRRGRRIIFNNDGGDMRDPGATTVDGFLSVRNRQALDTQVDSLFYCTTTTLMGTYLSQVSEVPAEFGGPYVDNIAALKEVGQDCLSATVEFCHRNELEVFWSHRINDIHDSFIDYLRCRWKREHPEYLLGTPEEAAIAAVHVKKGDRSVLPIKRFWSALNFEHRPVLDYLCRIQEDVCRRYDIDGLEIDYFRSPMFFPTIMEGQPATPSQVEVLTNFHRRLRKVHLDEGTRRGRPILTAARIPGTIERCRFVGIDIHRWIQEGLVDVLTLTGGYLPFTEPVDEMIQLAHDACIPAYPTISASGMGDDYPRVEAWRGAAMNMWRAGADGINTFNIFPTEAEPRFWDLGSTETLAGLNKIFAIEPNPTYKKGDLMGDAMTWPYPLPLPIPGDGSVVETKLPIGDDLPAAGKSGTLKSAVLRIRLSAPEPQSAVEVRLNEDLLTPMEQDLSGDHGAQTGWMVFQPRAGQYRLGLNQLSFRPADSSSEGKSPGDVTHVEVAVVYH